MASFTNQATLTYNGLVTNSNVASGELLEVLSAADYHRHQCAGQRQCYADL